MVDQNIINLRKDLSCHEVTSYGFKGKLEAVTNDQINYLVNIDKSYFREIFYSESNLDVDLSKVEEGQDISIALNLGELSWYYETFQDLVKSHKLELPNYYYIHDFPFQSGNKNVPDELNKLKLIHSIIDLLTLVCYFKKSDASGLELLFNDVNDLCSVKIEYDSTVISSIGINTSLETIENHIADTSDKEARKRIFAGEITKILKTTGVSFSNLIAKWDLIHESYFKSYELYLSGFSFEKIKTSSQEYFHELTDRIYSTINKFSTYILAIPFAYIFILRFFDFAGNSFVKDTFLLIAGLFYFVIVWFVLLSNLIKAFKVIENDITQFQERISNESSLNLIRDSLETQKKKIIPNQRNKIRLVQATSIVILILTFSAYIYIHHDKFLNWWNSCLLFKT